MTTSMMSSSITECITRQQVSLYMDGDGRACLVRLANILQGVPLLLFKHCLKAMLPFYSILHNHVYFCYTTPKAWNAKLGAGSFFAV